MGKRHQDAVGIQQGACNPSGVARSLVAAIDEARAENPDTDSVRADPAVRLICHQLAFLLKVDRVDVDYSRLMAECEEKGGVKFV